jgi:hypothetical protein
MSDPAQAAPNAAERSPLSLKELAALPDGAPELSEPLPDWVTKAHLQWLETGEGDPWGGYFS